MQYNKLGNAGIRVSEISFGSWITFGKQIGTNEIKTLMHAAFDRGINFFDNAEAYAHGEAETLMGNALMEFHREDLVVSTKIFWGGNGPNDTGLSRKHLIEGTKNSLRRLKLDYVDLLFCHRPDPNTPIEETTDHGLSGPGRLCVLLGNIRMERRPDRVRLSDCRKTELHQTDHGTASLQYVFP